MTSELARRPKFILSRRQATTLVVFAYFGLVALVTALFIVLELVQGYDDARNIDATVIFAIVMLFPFGWALASVHRRSRRPSWPAE